MNILIVDDEPLIRRSLEKLFVSRGHVVQTSDNGLDGFDKWEKMKPELVFLDVLMPGLTGPEVLKKMPIPRLSKVILISAFTGDLQLDQKHQPDLFIQKPFENILEIYEKSLGLFK